MVPSRAASLFLFASGIGITQSLDLIRGYNKSKRYAMLWVVRESAMLEHFLQYTIWHLPAFALIFFTGHPDTLLIRPDVLLHLPNVRLIFGRPKDVQSTAVDVMRRGPPLIGQRTGTANACALEAV